MNQLRTIESMCSVTICQISSAYIWEEWKATRWAKQPGSHGVRLWLCYLHRQYPSPRELAFMKHRNSLDWKSTGRMRSDRLVTEINENEWPEQRVNIINNSRQRRKQIHKVHQSQSLKAPVQFLMNEWLFRWFHVIHMIISAPVQFRINIIYVILDRFTIPFNGPAAMLHFVLEILYTF